MARTQTAHRGDNERRGGRAPVRAGNCHRGGTQGTNRADASGRACHAGGSPNRHGAVQVLWRGLRRWRRRRRPPGLVSDRQRGARPADPRMKTNPNGPMTGKPLPAVTKKIRKLLLAREEVAQTIERLIAILDEIDGEAELEPTGDEDEPTLGWPTGVTRVTGSTMDGEAEPSLGWTGIINQASRNRLGDGEDYEQDDADHEDSDPGEESDEGELEPDAEPNGDEMDGNLAGTTTTEEEAAYSPSLQYITRLRKRRGQSVPARHGPLAP